MSESSLVPGPQSRPTALSELTGELVGTWSEAWRHECECRYVLGLLNEKGAGPAYLQWVEKQRGSAAAHRLHDDVVKLREIRRRARQLSML